jgi:hypothetical protein
MPGAIAKLHRAEIFRTLTVVELLDAMKTKNADDQGG